MRGVEPFGIQRQLTLRTAGHPQPPAGKTESTPPPTEPAESFVAGPDGNGSGAPQVDLGALADTVRTSEAGKALELLGQAGVKGGQRTGSEFDGELQGDSAQQQKLEWRLGQASQLISHGHKGWADEVLEGRHDRLAGNDTGVSFRQRQEQREIFQLRHGAKGWDELGSSTTFKTPADMAKHEVAFLYQDPDTGQMREHQGKLNSGDASSFRLDGHDTERPFQLGQVDTMVINPKKPFFESVSGWILKH